jgi:hypothetical protein
VRGVGVPHLEAAEGAAAIGPGDRLGAGVGQGALCDLAQGLLEGGRPGAIAQLSGQAVVESRALGDRALVVGGQGRRVLFVAGPRADVARRRREDMTFKLLGGYWSRRVIRRD